MYRYVDMFALTVQTRMILERENKGLVYSSVISSFSYFMLPARTGALVGLFRSKICIVCSAKKKSQRNRMHCITCFGQSSKSTSCHICKEITMIKSGQKRLFKNRWRRFKDYPRLYTMFHFHKTQNAYAKFIKP